jgi:hypothetical protein
LDLSGQLADETKQVITVRATTVDRAVACLQCASLMALGYEGAEVALRTAARRRKPAKGRSTKSVNARRVMPVAERRIKVGGRRKRTLSRYDYCEEIGARSRRLIGCRGPRA